ncbi:MAG TPA: DNA-directed RNA polymerase subunit L [Pyrodictium delaneyi]|uniref:DNA-directed RNA polymerase subunit Rpo11 n=1 Tax=Pyrodictium delaneyi TaxID=1273541 RepID=A0A832ZSZ0_9CREN|nr:DNA-directed RNA polymerase subunit L [Pyrodictium delaneyi]
MTGKVKLLKREGSTIEIELVGEDHTIANLIAKYAIRKSGVVYSSYIISHPLIGNPVIVLSTDGSRDPLDVIEEVLRDIIKDASEFQQAFEEALRNNGECKA